MNAPSAPIRFYTSGVSALERRLRAEVDGEVLFDAFSRGRYSTDASIYQMEPVGVIVPETIDDVAAAMAIARDEGVPVLARGGGTSQCGQTVNRALVIDCSKHLRRILHVDVTIICEAPKVSPHRAAMAARLAEILGLEANRCSVKATTTEGLGFTGRREGIAAQAVATVELSGRG